MTPVALKLTGSRSAHLLAKVAVSKGQPAADYWQAALDLRLDARALDPDHADAAWLEDALHPKMPGERTRRYHRMPGLTAAQVARVKDDELVAYFRDRVNPPAAAAPIALTDQELAAKVVVPEEWRVVEKAKKAPCAGQHDWLTLEKTRRCLACKQHEQLTPKKAVEDTEAFKQLQRERGQ